MSNFSIREMVSIFIDQASSEEERHARFNIVRNTLSDYGVAHVQLLPENDQSSFLSDIHMQLAACEGCYDV